MSNLVVNEIFGATFQGEGKNIGTPCFFLRLSGCNLACVWCDTPYTWDWTGKNGKAYDKKEEAHTMTVETAYEKLRELQQTPGNEKVYTLVISGGEPMLQQRSLVELVYTLHAKGWWVEVETAGTIAPLPSFNPDQFTVSLKLKNSGNLYDKRHIENAVAQFARDRRSVFKFVVASMEDFVEIDAIQKAYDLNISNIYIMPEGITPEKVQEHSQAVAKETIKRGWKLTTRMQILLYGNQRGV